ncbi:MAG: ABC transporter [Candidatus Poribacteria bacterium]|nr:MAG: ABC transporter [Candidatus Poribacteria bacterium]
MSDATVIQVEGLTKRFGDLVAVDNLSFSVQRGEILGLLGPNGAGKTTTIQMMLGLTTPTAGTVRILGMDIRRHRREILQRVNFSSAYVALPSNLTVLENLTVFAWLYGIRRPRKRIEALLELFEIPQVLHQITGALSSGQQTRVNLCKAFLNDPEVLFLDEPTASLDPDIAEKVRSTLLHIQKERGVTMVYTSHNMREVELVCDRLLFLSRGKVIASGTPKEVIRRARSRSLEDVFIRIARGGVLVDTQQPEED